MKHENVLKNIHNACADLAGFGGCFADAMNLQRGKVMVYPEKADVIAGAGIHNCDELIKEIHKQRRNLVRARYELRKEQENEKNE